MPDSGSNPFGEPDFSALHPPGGEDASDDEFTDQDDELDDEDDELNEDEDGDEDDEAGEAGEAAEAEAVDTTGGSVAEGASTSNSTSTSHGDVDEDDAGNRVAGGTARSVLEHVARSIVDDPDGVTVEVAESRGGVRLSLHVAQGDMGRIIGRRGRTAQALRTLVRAAAARDGQEASVDIVD